MISPQEYELKYGEFDQIFLPLAHKNLSKRKSFRFKKLFDDKTTQQEIFETVAKPIIDDFLSGYNGTIFTYGQSRSGKTYTMTGDLRETKNYGLIPRTILEIFSTKKKNAVIRVTYCEIYNERVYDLIGNVGPEADNMKGLHFKNLRTTMFRSLRVHKVDTATEALDLLIRGNTKKMIAETESGLPASRSHVIFSVRLELPCTEDGILHLNPILHLVDLTSAESRENSSGNALDNRNINLSLLYLEHVLLALRRPRKMRQPFRNSRMMGFLKKSLEGNSIPAVIATLSMSVNDVEQTIQTCHFSERLRQITIIANPNEIIIPAKKLINPLKDMELLQSQFKFLKAQLNVFLNNQLPEEELNEEEKRRCTTLVESYLAGSDIMDMSDFDVRKTIFCLQLLRELILKKEKESRPLGTGVTLNVRFSDVSLMSSNDLQSQTSRVFLDDLLAGNEKILPKLVKNKESTKRLRSKKEIKECKSKLQEAVSNISITGLNSEEIILVQKEIPNRPELVLCIVKSGR